jgi:glyoxylase-like metal-dependent hydrolase (beta-lactamase superfamily II)
MPVSTDSYSIATLELGPMQNFIYLLHDHASDRLAVVDPAWEPEIILAWAEQRALPITDILLTHSHNDHINAVEAVLMRHDAQLHLLKPEAQFWGNHLDLPALHHGGDVLQFGKTPIEILHTPGHTPGSACYHIGNDLIAGDTLFVFGCGRCDLRGGDPNEMYDTLRRLRTELPGDTVVRPGHNYSVKTTSTIDDEIAGNPFMHFNRREEFVDYRLHIHDRVRHSPYHAEPHR